MNLKKCVCGSKRLVKSKFGGEDFRVNLPNAMTLLVFSGYSPDIYICRDCGKISFYAPDKMMEKLEAED